MAPVATNTPFDYSENLVISVGVSDMEKAIEWYQDVLGLELVYKLESTAGARWPQPRST